MAEVANVTGLPKSSAFRYLSTLEARRYVERSPASGNYQVGMALLRLQTHRFEVLRQQAMPYLVKLRDQFGETINLGLLDRGRIYYLEIVESQRGVRLAARAGDRDYIHCTALGKAISATLSEEQVLAILKAEGMPKRTPRTLITPSDFLADLEVVKSQGFALDDAENEPDGRCVAVSLGGSWLLAGLSLSAPASRFPMEDVPMVVGALNRAANELAAEAGAPATSTGDWPAEVAGAPPRRQRH